MKKSAYCFVISVLLLLIGIQAASAGDAVLVMHFEESKGYTAQDSSGMNNHGTIYNPIRVTGKIGKGLYLDGTKGYVAIPDSPSLRPEKLTISAWVKPAINQASIDYVMPILIKTESDAWYHAGGYDFVYGETGLSLSVAYSPIWRRGYDTSVSLPAYQWSHVAATFDENELVIYVNGKKIGSGSTPWSIQYSADDVWIGRWYQVASDHSGGMERKGDYFFKGSIDEVLLFNRALSATEVNNLYVNPYYVPSASLTADFTASPQSGVAPLQVYFDDKSTGEVIKCKWYFGDGTSSITIGDVTHVYSVPGTYIPKLYVWSTNSISEKIGNPIQVTASQTGAILSAYWGYSYDTGDYVEHGTEGLTYACIVTTDSLANGNKVIFDIYESDLLDKDLHYITTLEGYVINQKAHADWTAVYIDDGFGEGDPEYKFKARIEGTDTTVMSGNLVIQRESSLSPFVSLPCDPDFEHSDRNIVNYIGPIKVGANQEFDAIIEIRPPQEKVSAASLIFLTRENIEGFEISTDRCSPGFKFDPTKSTGAVDYIQYSDEPLWTFVTTLPDVAVLAINTALINRPDYSVAVLENICYYGVFQAIGYQAQTPPIQNPPQFAVYVANNMMTAVDEIMKKDIFYVIEASNLDPAIPLMTKTGGTEYESNSYQVKLRLKAPYQAGYYKLAFDGNCEILAQGGVSYYTINRDLIINNNLVNNLALGDYHYNTYNLRDYFTIQVV